MIPRILMKFKNANGVFERLYHIKVDKKKLILLSTHIPYTRHYNPPLLWLIPITLGHSLLMSDKKI